MDKIYKSAFAFKRATSFNNDLSDFEIAELKKSSIAAGEFDLNSVKSKNFDIDNFIKHPYKIYEKVEDQTYFKKFGLHDSGKNFHKVFSAFERLSKYLFYTEVLYPAIFLYVITGLLFEIFGRSGTGLILGFPALAIVLITKGSISSINLKRRIKEYHDHNINWFKVISNDAKISIKAEEERESKRNKARQIKKSKEKEVKEFTKDIPDIINTATMLGRKRK